MTRRRREYSFYDDGFGWPFWVTMGVIAAFWVTVWVSLVVAVLGH